MCRFRYRLGNTSLTETVALSAPADTHHGPTRAALDLVSHVLGVSYYKAAAPPIVRVGEVSTTDEMALLGAVYGPGLGELRWTNGLDLAAVPTISAVPTIDATAGRVEVDQPRDGAGEAPVTGDGPVLVPVGGGKDSVVTIELLTAAGHDVVLFAVNDHPAIEAVIAASGLPAERVVRRLDPVLFELNAAGALNGHVPVTAIVSALAVLTAVQHGCSAVAMSNERSASAPNLDAGGVEVNHQYSKSLGFERILRRAVHATVGPSVDYFSLLRPLSELSIMATFARLDRYHPHFTSCNRAFAVLDENRSPSWCGDCDKCRFVFLALAPFLDPGRLVPIIGRDLLAATDQLDGFRQLVGLQGARPFECVGEIDECRTAVGRLAADPEWSSRPVVTTLQRELAAAGASHPDETAVFARSDDHLVPDRFLDALDGAATIPTSAAR